MIIDLLRAAGVVHLIFVGANVALPGILDFESNLKKIPPIMRQIFLVHHAYIMGVLGLFAALCLFFPHELAGGSTLGTVICSFMAAFWLVRIPIQLFYYDADLRRERWREHFLFSFALICLAATLSAAALRGIL